MDYAVDIPSMMLSCYPSLAVLISGILYAATSAVTQTSGDLQQEYDLCGSHPPEVIVDVPGDSVLVYINVAQGVAITLACQATFTTCDNCRFRVSAVQPQFEYPVCWQSSSAENHCDLLFCMYLILFDGDYKSRRRIVTNSLTADGFETESKSLQILLCRNYISSNTTAMLRLTAVEKIQHITGDMPETWPFPRTFKSPNFPSPYVRNNEYYTYTFESSSRDQFITVTFDDWMFSPYSTIKFDGANIVSRIDGGNARPYIVSSGKAMNMTFCTGERRKMSSDHNFLGFKGEARFYTNLKDIPHIEPGCDRLVSTSEGGILHLNAAADGQNRDCIWIIKKLSGFDGVYLKIVRYKTRYELNTCDYSLEVREGLTSETVRGVNLRLKNHNPNYAVRLSENGFYIRIKGCYFDDSVVLSYAMYLDDCDDYREYYKCDNGRCIAYHLKCDTYDHCGDSSDEIPSMCGRVPTKIRTGVGDYSSNVNNSSGASYDYTLSIHVIIPVVVSVVLGIGIMCLLILLVRRCRRLNNSVAGRSQNIHGRRGRGRRFNWRNRSLQMSVTMSSGEHPPSYEEVIRSTPIGQLNMAFSWSACEGAFAQPPPYDEAVSPSTAQPAANSTHAALTNSISSSSSCICGTGSNLPQYHSRPFLVATLSASLCPAADLTSASSGATTDNTHRLDVVLSSESTHRQNPLTSADCVSGSLFTSSNQNKNKGEPNSENSSNGNIANPGNIGLAVLDSRTCPQKKDGNLSVHSNIIIQRNNNNKAVAGKSTTSDDENSSKDVDTVRSVRGEMISEGGSRSRKQGRGLDIFAGHCRTESAQELPTLGTTSSGCVVSILDDGGVNGLRMAHGSRSQSCADLLLNTEGSRLLGAGGTRRPGDKRFSYAGAGDVSLVKRGLDPSSNSITMLNTVTQEYPSRRSTVSSDSPSDINRTSNNIKSTVCEAVSSDPAPKKHNLLNNQGTVFSKSRTDKQGVPAPSSLDPVLENSNDEHDLKVTSFEVAMKSEPNRYKDNKAIDGISQDVLSRNKMFPVLSVQYRSETFHSGNKQMKPDVPQKISKHESKNSKDVPAAREVKLSHNVISSSHNPGVRPAYAKDHLQNQHKNASLQSGNNCTSSAV